VICVILECRILKNPSNNKHVFINLIQNQFYDSLKQEAERPFVLKNSKKGGI